MGHFHKTLWKNSVMFKIHKVLCPNAMFIFAISCAREIDKGMCLNQNLNVKRRYQRRN